MFTGPHIVYYHPRQKAWTFLLNTDPKLDKGYEAYFIARAAWTRFESHLGYNRSKMNPDAGLLPDHIYAMDLATMNLNNLDYIALVRLSPEDHAVLHCLAACLLKNEVEVVKSKGSVPERQGVVYLWRCIERFAHQCWSAKSKTDKRSDGTWSRVLDPRENPHVWVAYQDRRHNRSLTEQPSVYPIPDQVTPDMYPTSDQVTPDIYPTSDQVTPDLYPTSDRSSELAEAMTIVEQYLNQDIFLLEETMGDWWNTSDADKVLRTLRKEETRKDEAVSTLIRVAQKCLDDNAVC